MARGTRLLGPKPPTASERSARAVKGSIEIIGMDRLNAKLDKFAGLQNAVALIGTDLVNPPYPYFLEYGTSRMSPRPSARPAFDESKPTAIATLLDLLNQMVVRNDGPPGPQAAGMALEGAALVIANAWKERVPVRTGTYRRSIRVEVTYT